MAQESTITVTWQTPERSLDQIVLKGDKVGSRIDLDQGMVSVWANTGKNKRTVVVPLNLLVYIDSDVVEFS